MNPATHRAQLVGMLAFSLKQSADEDLLPQELAAVQRWRREIIAIATDEMLHLVLANNLGIAIGARPHYRRFNFPIATGLFPSDMAVELAPLNAATVDHFVYLERPADTAERDGARYGKTNHQRHSVEGRLMMMADDYATVGELYETIETSCVLISEHLGEARLFIGPRDAQLAPADFRLPGIMTIGSLVEAKQALEFIRHQGEGSRGDKAGSHYARFRAIRDEWHALERARPAFTPARPAARNPVLRDPIDPAARLHVTAEPAASLLDVGNVCYEQMLRLLTALSDVTPRGVAASARRGAICEQTLALMHTLAEVGSLLTTLPASAAHPGVTAGLTFTASRTVLAFLSAETATLLMAERFGCVADRLHTLAAQVPSLAPHAKLMSRFSRHWSLEHDQRWPAMAANAAVTSAAKEPAMTTPTPATPAKAPDEARGRDVLLRFDTQRCIHARHCVLGEPAVFLANTPGDWLYPDQATPERIAIVAANCPSGAVTYERLDGGPNETAPRVNVLRVRENGPLALHADLHITGQEGRSGSAFRATLCRCGASANKPYCDGSHNAAGFKASGEPVTKDSQPLAARDGVLHITPTRNGPLAVKGNLELCAGTGRTVDRVSATWLCRCGQSQNKPYCDGSHGRVGFTADGA